ncbi:MAG TPA: tetratricopeptide repeat protein, partial [Gemmatimonadaceae bacterium]|nr:tetratricopeptide repeat protein [Gemmatimonadaceae bacterium]
MPPSDAVRRLSDALARDPASPAALELAELLAARGDLDAARRVAAQAAARHPLRAAAHDLVARLAAQAEDWRVAHEAWCRVLSLAAADAEQRAAALLGQAYVAFR